MTNKQFREYMRQYAEAKQIARAERNDLGAFGDLHETLVRIAMKGNYNLLHMSDLHVKKAGRADIIHHGVKFEVGQNGKTWQEGSEADAMEGKFKAVAYGMYDEFTINAVYAAIADDRIEYAVEIIKAYTCVWTDKYQFLQDMSEVPARGKFFTIKNEKVANQFNAGLYNRFEGHLENGEYMTLGEYLDV